MTLKSVLLQKLKHSGKRNVYPIRSVAYFIFDFVNHFFDQKKMKHSMKLFLVADE